MKSLKKYAGIIVVLVVSILIVATSKFIYQGGFLKDKARKNVTYEKAIVKSIDNEKIQKDEKLSYIEVGMQNITVELRSGEYKGQVFQIKNSISRLYNTKVEKDMEIVVAILKDKNEISDITIYSYKRSNVIYALVGIFILTIIGIGRFKGVKSVVALIFTFVSIIFFMIPLMLRGVSPIVASIGVALMITFVTLYLLNGRSKKTYCAIIGTVMGVVAAGIISYISGHFAHLSGLTMENTENMLYVAENSSLKLHEIMFAGILIASLGAVMDVAMSISSALYEIFSLNHKLSSKDLFKSGMNIGQDIIGTMSNTLILAFAGGSLGIIILITSSNMGSLQLLNLDIVGTEIIQGISGSIGVVLTVPFTALICSLVYKKFPKNK